MKNLTPIMALLTTILFSCSKEEVLPDSYNTENQNQLVSLAIGNYWVYERATIDTLGNETTHAKLDSAYISRDTVISGKTFFIVEGDFFAKLAIGGSYLRSDANSLYSHNLVKEHTLFSLSNIGKTYASDTIRGTNQDLFYVSRSMLMAKQNKLVGAGQFSCFVRKDFYTPVDPNYIYGIRESDNFYAIGVGAISTQTFYMSSPNTEEVRLLRYGSN